MNAREWKRHMSEIGRKGGRRSRRTLTPEQARAMRDARTKKERGHNAS